MLSRTTDWIFGLFAAGCSAAAFSHGHVAEGVGFIAVLAIVVAVHKRSTFRRAVARERDNFLRQRYTARIQAQEWKAAASQKPNNEHPRPHHRHRGDA